MEIDCFHSNKFRLDANLPKNTLDCYKLHESGTFVPLSFSGAGMWSKKKDAHNIDSEGEKRRRDQP